MQVSTVLPLFPLYCVASMLLLGILFMSRSRFWFSNRMTRRENEDGGKRMLIGDSVNERRTRE